MCILALYTKTTKMKASDSRPTDRPEASLTAE